MQNSTTFSSAGNGLRLGAWLGIAAPTLALPRFAREGCCLFEDCNDDTANCYTCHQRRHSLPCEAGEGQGGGSNRLSDNMRQQGG
jgi:hypothetical protein